MIRRLFETIGAAFHVRDVNHAMKLKTIWSFGYAVIGWNLFAVVIYSIVKDVQPKTIEEQREMYRKMGGKDAELNVIQVHGLSIQPAKEVDTDTNNNGIIDSTGNPNPKIKMVSEFKWPSEFLIQRQKEETSKVESNS